VFISQFRSQNEKEAPENTSRKKIGSPQWRRQERNSEEEGEEESKGSIHSWWVFAEKQ
jgi:hypothetical protein